MAGSWSRLEVEATVADYFSMLEAELREEPLNKTEHRRRLSPLLVDRSDGAIERKHQNISAILLKLGYPYVDGYKPLVNYQQLLFDVVEDRLAQARELTELVKLSVEKPQAPPTVEDILTALVDPPKPSNASAPTVRERPTVSRKAVDYLAIEARNAALGLAGEEFALNFERARLIYAERAALADQIEHTSVAVGDGPGYDIRSFETDGSERFIEVKTTGYGIYTPFYLSRNEVAVSADLDEKYHLYRPFHFRKQPQLFTIAGSLGRTCKLEATQYVGRVA